MPHGNASQLNSPPIGGAAAAAAAIGALKVKGCDEGETMIVRLLSTDYGGLFTHYFKGRSRYCQGKECNPLAHKEPRVWKGYCAAERFAGGTTWHPICLEMSEALELDMRTIFARGQLWQIWRDVKKDGKNQPVMGKLLEERGPDSCPIAFNYLSCLLHLYHVENVDLSCPNPLPPRLIVTASQGDAPLAVRELTKEPLMTPEEYAEKRRQQMDRMKAPSRVKEKQT